MKLIYVFVLLLVSSFGYAQKGIIIGTVLGEKDAALEGASVSLISIKDSTARFSTSTDKDGFFFFEALPYDHYRINISYVGLQPLTLDSIHVRAEREDFNLGDIRLKLKSSEKLEEIIIYLEKPLIESKDGNITFNASESALSNSSSASELLNNVPLVTKDPDGKILVRGKEPRILIDDKPVELNMQQLQDLLESMPGSSVEKIEVMTNPPPQFANEQGGVINIITKKGAVGMGGRVTLFAGTRGDRGGNGSFNYRKKGMSLTVNAGIAGNQLEGWGYSNRQNVYRDSSNFFKTNNNYTNNNWRPNVRMNFDYELNKFNSINAVFQFNQNHFNNSNNTTYRNINRVDELFRLSNRNIRSLGENTNPNLSLNYTLKTKRPGEVFKINSSLNVSDNLNERNFYQHFLDPVTSISWFDSTQLQVTDNNTKGYNLRANYDRPLSNKKTFISLGTFYNRSMSNILTDASFKRSSDGTMQPLDVLSNHFTFYQNIVGFRSSVKQVFGRDLSTTAGFSTEKTAINFDLYKAGTDTSNQYWSILPFATFNKKWTDKLNLTLSYRRTIRRPGINELNPTIDFSDPYNLRFGNPQLEASTVHNFDLVVGRTIPSFFTNLGVGYNIVQDIFSPIRTLVADGKTEITWQNFSGRKEYEISTWNGYTFNKKWRVNLNASYTYNKYSDFDKQNRNFRDGASVTTNLSTNYNWKDFFTTTGSFTVNRFANPQGTVRSAVSMNLGVQAKLLNKKMTVSFNSIDPIMQQENRVFTYGRNFNLESFNTTQTKNYRLSVSYNLTKSPKSNKKKVVAKKPPTQQKQATKQVP